MAALVVVVRTIGILLVLVAAAMVAYHPVAFGAVFLFAWTTRTHPGPAACGPTVPPRASRPSASRVGVQHLEYGP